MGDYMFKNGFPFINDEIVNRVITLIPQKTYRNITIRVSNDDINYCLKQTSLSFPYRLYTPEIEDSVLLGLNDIERTILHCIYTRSCDGFIREKHIKYLLTSNFPEWSIPYIVKVCDEYVIEILQTVYDHLKNRNTDIFKQFCKENWRTFCKSYNHMVSYWNEFYRDDCYRYEDYVGRKLFIDCFGAKRTMNCIDIN